MSVVRSLGYLAWSPGMTVGVRRGCGHVEGPTRAGGPSSRWLLRHRRLWPGDLVPLPEIPSSPESQQAEWPGGGYCTGSEFQEATTIRGSSWHLYNKYCPSLQVSFRLNNSGKVLLLGF